MADLPMLMKAGLDALLRSAEETGKQVHIVVVTSSSNGYQESMGGLLNGIISAEYAELFFAGLSSPSGSRMLLDANQVLYYTAPSWTSHNRLVQEGIIPRVEKAPEIPVKADLYLLLDDQYEQGNTAFCAAKALVEQGAELDNVWLFSYVSPAGLELRLDKARKFLEYSEYAGLEQLDAETGSKR
jgi:hypothetical protein